MAPPHLRLWIFPDVAHGLVETFGFAADEAPDIIRDAVRYDVPMLFLHADGTEEVVASKDRSRIMVDHGTGLAWLTDAGEGGGQAGGTAQSRQALGAPYKVQGPSLREHLERLAPALRGPAKPKRTRPVHELQLKACQAAMLFCARHGEPKKLSRLVSHMQEAIAAEGLMEPSERSLRTWAEEYCAFWRKILSEQRK